MNRGSYALAAYVVATVAATWPLTVGLVRDVPWDLGDSVLNMWILSWDVEQFRQILSGDFSRITRFFDANIFHPFPTTLAYSEHLLAQAVQIAPLHLITNNPILSYNLLFIATFALSGLGTYLLVRELTGSGWAALIAGLLFAFAPYRIAQGGHLQILSSQWMPFALYGLLRYFDTLRIRPLAGAALALVAQNLSCGYYLLFFPPFVVAFVVWQVTSRNLWRNRQMWTRLGTAALFVTVCTVPFLLPYAALRAQGFAQRSPAEIARFSADVYSYASAFPFQRVWGHLQAFPKQEGELFPGLVPVILAFIGVATWRFRGHTEPLRRWAAVLAALSVGHFALALAMLAVRRMNIDAGFFTIRIGNINQLFLRAAVGFALLLILSPAVRARTGSFLRERGFFVAALLVALWLSLGPSPFSLGRPLEFAGLYSLLLDHVPGFDGLRVPARFAMIAALMLSVLGGYGAAWLLRHRVGRIAAAVLTVFFLVEATHVPFTVNGVAMARGYQTPEARVYPPARAPAVYRALAAEPSSAVVAELPLGYPDYDQRAMFYSTVHWRALVNGYSGFTPPHYGRLKALLSEIPRHADVSLMTLSELGVTHVIVHETAFLGDEGPATTAALRAAGAVELFRQEGDVLFRITS